VHTTLSSASTQGIVGRTPAVPSGWEPSGEVTLRPFGQQESLASGMARELDANTNFRDDFGTRCPEGTTIAAALDEATQLTNEAARARAWANYLDERSGQAWQRALTLTGKFKKDFDRSCEYDTNIALRHPQSVAFYGVRVESAQRASVTRRYNRAAKKNNPA
jgi:hypothetical protein